MPNDLPFNVIPQSAPDLLSMSENPGVLANARATGTNRGSASSRGAFVVRTVVRFFVFDGGTAFVFGRVLRGAFCGTRRR
jgi:hypothetical protein